MKSVKSLCEISVETLSKTRNVIVAGDIHGDLASFQSIHAQFDPQQDLIVFLGDYADRGPKGVEVIAEITQLKKKFPDRVYTLKGNHEDYTEDGKPTFSPCSLKGEVTEKIGDWKNYFQNKLKPFIDELNLAVIIPGVVIFVHGGISNKILGLKDLKRSSREIEKDILWSDPFEGPGERFNRRGAGIEFGADISKKVCWRLGVGRVVRSHQPGKAVLGPCVEHDGRVITISSTRVYGGIPFILKMRAKNMNGAFKDIKKQVKKLD